MSYRLGLFFLLICLFGCSNARLGYSAPAPIQESSPNFEKKPAPQINPETGKLVSPHKPIQKAINTKDKNTNKEEVLQEPGLVEKKAPIVNTTSTKASAPLFLIPKAVGRTEKEQKAPPVKANPKPTTTQESDKVRFHVVKVGETLYSIGLKYDIEPQMLAQINHINPTQLKVGQRLQVSEGQSVLKEGLDSDQEKNKKNTLTPLKPIFPEQSSLVWPHEGNLASSFKEDGDKGIVIVGHESDPILAIAAGKVLYAGSSLKGYGNLLIIKHDDHWISTYAHNKTLLVKEGQMVKRGQKIALMGKSDAPRIMLHFELRYQGKPLDPLLYLPSKQ